MTGFDNFWISSTTFSTALSIPRLSSIGLEPAATFFRPSRKMDWARTVAVVVPSPATSDVLEATSRTILAPRFSTGSAKSISLATVTPSLVTTGEPNFFSSTTLRPLGPKVTRTALAKPLTPRRIAWRASSWYVICFAMVLIHLSNLKFDRDPYLLDDAENLVLTEDEVVGIVQLDFGARVFAYQDFVSDFDLQGELVPVLEYLDRSRWR